MNFDLEIGKHGKISFNEMQAEYICQQYFEEKKSMLNISKELSCSPQIIARTIRETGREPRKVGVSNRLYYADDYYFSVIDSEEKAYWLGMLYADGTIQEDRGTVNLGLQTSDEEHIKKFIYCLKSNNPIKRYIKVMDGKEFSSSRVNIYSRQMVDDLIRLGCTQNKSLTLTFPTEEQVPNHLIIHFIRGYFDGDGSISYTTPYKTKRRQYKYSFVGTKSFIDGIKSHLEIEHLKTSNRKKELFAVGSSGRKQVEHVLGKMYKGATIFLQRKYDKYQEMIQYTLDNPYIPWNKGVKNIKENGE